MKSTFAKTFRMDARDVIRELIKAGLDSIRGAARSCSARPRRKKAAPTAFEIAVAHNEG